MNTKKNLIILLFLLLLCVTAAVIVSCQKIPLNPFDPLSIEGGYVTPMPDFTTEEGIYNKDISVSVCCDDEDAVIYYTLDGSDPDEDSSVYTGALHVLGDGTSVVIKAAAKHPDKNISAVSGSSFQISYLDLLIESSEHGSVSPSGPVRVAGDGVQEVSAAPDSGYAFAFWSVESGSGIEIEDIYADSTNITLADVGGTVKAHFETGLSLTVSDDGNGTTEPAGEVLVAEGIPRIISAAPSTGYRFNGWSVISGSGAIIADSTASSTTVTLDSGGVEVQAGFELLTYMLTVSSGTGGTVTPGSPTTVNHGSAIAITATPASGYMFDGWSIISGAGVTIADSGSASTTVSLTDGDAEVRANFRILRTLYMADDGNGTTTPGAGSYQVGDGLSQSVSATPDTGYGFSHWSVSGSAAVTDEYSPATTVILSGGDGTVTANFTDNTYELTVNSGGNGTVNPSGTISVVHGVSTNINAVPTTAGYEFGSWSVTSGSATIEDDNSASTTVILTSGAAAIRANFVLKTYTLTVNDDGYGSTTPSGGSSVTHGVDYNISASPDTGYNFDYWSVESGTADIDSPSSASTTIALTGGAATIRANFTPMEYGLTVTNDGNGSTNPAGDVPAYHAIAMNISAAPSADYIFDSWSVVSGSGVDFGDQSASSTTVTLTGGAAVIRANFLPTYTLTVSDDGNGTTTPSGSLTVTRGVDTIITATPGTGYEFAEWTTTDSGVNFGNITSPSTTVTLNSGNAEITANFQLKQYTLTIENDGNTVTAPSGNQTVEHGNPVSIEAMPEAGFVFDSWEVTSGSGTNIADAQASSTNIILTDGDVTIRAVSKAIGWAKRYNATGDNGLVYIYSIAEVPGDEFLAVGSYNADTSSEGTDLLIARIDTAGDVLWSKVYGDPAHNSTGNSDDGRIIVPTSDSNYLIGGTYYEYSVSVTIQRQPWIMKVSETGEVIWQKRFQMNGSVSNIGEDSSGNIYLYMTGNNAPYIKKLNSSGSVQWTLFDYEANARADFDSEGNTMLWSLKDDSGTNVHVFSIIDSNGDLVQQSTYDYLWGIQDCLKTEDDGYLITTGSTVSGTIKLDSTGAIEWQRQYSAGFSYIIPQKIIQLASGGFLFGSSLTYYNDNKQAFLFETDGNGIPVSLYLYGNSSDEQCLSVLPVSSGGNIITGYDTIEGDGNYGWIMKADENGLCGGYEESFTVTASTTSITQRSPYTFTLSSYANSEANTYITGRDINLTLAEDLPE